MHRRCTTASPRCRRSTTRLRLRARLRPPPARPAVDAQAALRLPVPQRRTAIITVRLKPACRAQRTQAIALHPRGRDDARMAPARRRELPGHRRAGDRLRPDGSITRSLECCCSSVPLVMAATLRSSSPGARGCCRSRSPSSPSALTFGAAGRSPAPRSRWPRSGCCPCSSAWRSTTAIQFQSRVGEERDWRGRRAPAPRAAVARRALGGPTIVTAAAATAAGFLVLLLSPVPMVRGFGAAARARHRARPAVRADGGRGGAGLAAAPAERRAGRPGRRRARASPALAAAPRAGVREIAARRWRGARACAPAWRQAPPPGPSARRRPRPGRARLGAGHPDERADRRDQARAAEPRLAAQPGHARARHRRRGEIDVMVSGATWPRPRRAVDERLPVGRARALRLLRERAAAVRRTLCPAFSLPDLFRRRRAPPRRLTTRPCPRAARPRSRPTSHRASSRPTGARRRSPSASA